MTKFLLVLAAALLFPVLAFATDAAVPDAHGALYGVVIYAVAHWLPFLSTLVVVTLLPAAVGWIAAKKKVAVSEGRSTVLLDIAEKVAHLAQLAAAAVDAKMVPDVAARAAKGELTSADGTALKAEGLSLVKGFLSPEGLKDLATALGTPKAPAAAPVVDAYIEAHIEHAVDVKNNTAIAAEAGGTPSPAVPAPT